MNPLRKLFPPDVVAQKVVAGRAVGRAAVPSSITNWLAKARLLYGVPFEYLVPDASLLPPESIRFFYLDQNWTDRLVDGAVSVGAFTTWERLHTEVSALTMRGAVDAAQAQFRREIRVRRKSAIAPARADLPAADPNSTPISGFLLRSRLVSAFPGMEVIARAQDTDDETVPPLQPLRLERPYPDLMLALFLGVPARVTLREPAEAILPGAASRSANSVEIEIKQLQGGVLSVPVGQRIDININSRGKLDVQAVLAEAERLNLGLDPANSQAAVAAALLVFSTALAFHTAAAATPVVKPDPSPRPGDIA